MPKKLDVLVEAPESLSLEHLRAAGLQPGVGRAPQAIWCHVAASHSCVLRGRQTGNTPVRPTRHPYSGRKVAPALIRRHHILTARCACMQARRKILRSRTHPQQQQQQQQVRVL